MKQSDPFVDTIKQYFKLRLEKEFFINSRKVSNINLKDGWIYKGHVNKSVILKHCQYNEKSYFMDKEHIINCKCPCGAILVLEDWQVFALRLAEK